MRGAALVAAAFLASCGVFPPTIRRVVGPHKAGDARWDAVEPAVLGAHWVATKHHVVRSRAKNGTVPDAVPRNA